MASELSSTHENVGVPFATISGPFAPGEITSSGP